MKTPVLWYTGVSYPTDLKRKAKMNLELNIIPGIILKKEFLEELHISARTLSIKTGILKTNMSQILKGKRNITEHISLFF